MTLVAPSPREKLLSEGACGERERNVRWGPQACWGLPVEGLGLLVEEGRQRDGVLVCQGVCRARQDAADIYDYESSLFHRLSPSRRVPERSTFRW